MSKDSRAKPPGGGHNGPREGGAGVPDEEGSPGLKRRDLFARATTAAMAGGLVAGYGSFAAIAARYLYPARPQRTGWVYVSDVASIKPGQSIPFITPSGAPAAIARRGDSGEASDFIALSSTCPHLGCQVHWQADKNEFLCPCHGGVFNASGKAIAGPPAEADQSLSSYPLKVDAGLLFIEVPLERLAAAGDSDGDRNGGRG